MTAMRLRLGLVALLMGFAMVGLALGPIDGVRLDWGAGALAAIGLVLMVWGRPNAAVRNANARGLGAALIAAAPKVHPRDLRHLAPDERTYLGVVGSARQNKFAEAFRDLARSTIGREGRVLAIAAARPEALKMSTSLALARTARLGGARVVVVDCDLRGRRLSKELGLEGALGAWEWARGAAGKEVVVPSGELEFDVLPAGGAGLLHRELYGQKGFVDLLRELSQTYDAVILDCPPVLGSVDTRFLARQAHLCVLTACYGKTPVGAVRAAAQTLASSHVPVAGVFVLEAPR